MKEDAYQTAPRKKGVNPKMIILLISLVLLLAAAIGGTVAFLVTNTGAAENTFSAARVTVGIDETLTDNTKSHIRFQNTGDVPAWIRATLVIYWTNAEGQTVPEPAGGAVTVGSAKNGWTLRGDIYYYADVVDVDGWTSEMLEPITVTAPDGYTCHVEVYAEGLQAAGDTDSGGIPAWQDAWENG